MKNKILTFILLLSLVFSATGFAFALEEPEKPVLTDSTNNESIKEYNTQVEAYNKKVDEYNVAASAEHQAAVADVQQKNEAGLKAQEESQKAHDDAVAAEAQANAEEKARVDAANQLIEEKNAAAQTAYEKEKTAVETHNTFVDNVDSKIETDSSESRGFTNNATHDAPTDWSDDTDENTLKTIQIEKSNNPSGQKIKVINLHVFLDETLPYSPDCYQTSIDDDSFELDEEMTNRAVLTEWETAEIDYDDTVTLFSEAANFAGNIVWLNGKRQWFGTDPKPYFFRAIEGYTQGYWMPGGSMMETTATVNEYGWFDGGETYTAQYAEETAYSSYLYNGQPMVEEITVRTTDKQEPKNIFAIFTYLFTRLASEPEKKEVPNPPELEELETFVPIVMEIPEIIYWTLIDDPEEPTYLSHLNFVDLLPTKPTEEPTKEPIEEPEEPIKKPTKKPTKNKPTIQTVASTTDIIIASNTPKVAIEYGI